MKKAIRTLARGVGLDVSRYRPKESPDGRFATMLSVHEVDVVLDVGANIGQFGESLRRGGYRGRIVSFEPLSAARARLVQASTRDSLWDVAPRCAIGDAEGEVELHIAGNSVSSSVLPMLSAHADAAPESVYVGAEKVSVQTLDAAAAAFLRPDNTVFLKIDTQGYEDRVLRGATQLLERIVGLQLEMSFVALYEGQLTFDAMRDRLTALGFELWSLAPGFVDPNTGRLLQVDATFFRA